MAYDDLAPRYVVKIGNTELGEDITQFVERVEYESADGMADQAKLVIQNPNLDLQDRKIFQPGNEMSIWLGYGPQIEHIGRVILRRTNWGFPQDDIPSIQVQGYTFDAKMMDQEPENPKARRFVDMTWADVVAEVAARYKGLQPDIDPTDDEPTNRTQTAGISDYRVIKAAANLTGYYFWVDGDEQGNWTLHFKSPSSVLDSVNQPDLNFVYNDQFATLLTFSPELLVQGSKTKIKVSFKDPWTGKNVEEEVEEGEESADIEATDSTADADDAYKNAGSIKIYFQDFSFEIEPKKRFKTAAEVKLWAAAWFRRQRENFILGSGMVIGVESLRARQFHTLGGIGKVLSGKWYFSRVRHVLSADDGYLCQFNARKQESLE